LQINIASGSIRKIPDDYSVANDFADWLTRTRCVSFRFNGGSVSFPGSESSLYTWGLIRRMVTNYKDVEHVMLHGVDAGLHLSPILKWLNFLKMKKLSIDGIENWNQGTVELELEAIMSVLKKEKP